MIYSLPVTIFIPLYLCERRIVRKKYGKRGNKIILYVFSWTKFFFLVTVFNRWENYDIYSNWVHISPPGFALVFDDVYFLWAAGTVTNL